MSNVFLSLPVPAGNGVGVSVDASAMGRFRSIAVVGGFQAILNIEISEDGITFGPLATFTAPDVETYEVAARWMRVRVAGWEAGPLPVVSVGSDDIGNLFAALPVPAGNGVGASVDISTFGLFKTVVISGPFQASIGVEVSEDGVNYVPLLDFAGPTTQSIMAVAQRARVRVAGYPGVGPLPTVTIAGVNDSAAGGGGIGAPGETLIGIVPLGGRTSHNSVTPRVVGAIAFDPTIYALTGTVRTIVLRAVAANGNVALTNYLKLVNVTDADDIAIVSFTTTSLAKAEAALVVGGGAGQIDPSEKIYEAQIYLGAMGGGPFNTIELYSVELRVINTLS